MSMKTRGRTYDIVTNLQTQYQAKPPKIVVPRAMYHHLSSVDGSMEVENPATALLILDPCVAVAVAVAAAVGSGFNVVVGSICGGR